MGQVAGEYLPIVHRCLVGRERTNVGCAPHFIARIAGQMPASSVIHSAISSPRGDQFTGLHQDDSVRMQVSVGRWSRAIVIAFSHVRVGPGMVAIHFAHREGKANLNRFRPAPTRSPTMRMVSDPNAAWFGFVHAAAFSMRTAWLGARSKASKFRKAASRRQAFHPAIQSSGTVCSEMPPCDRSGW